MVGGEHDHGVGGDLRPAVQRLQDAADVPVDLALQLRVQVEEAEPDQLRFRAAERHRPERRRGRVLQRALQPRLAAGASFLRASRSSAAAARRVRRAAASAGTRSLQTYHQAMSCGLTNETVVHHGCAPPSSLNQCRKCRAMIGSLCQPCPGPPSGEGYMPPAKPYCSSASSPSSGVQWLSPWVTCHLPSQRVLVAVLAQHRAPCRKAGVERAAAGDHAPGLVRVEAGQHRRARRGCSRWRPCSGARTRRAPWRSSCRFGGSVVPIAPAPNHCGKRSWSTTITRMLGRLRRGPAGGRARPAASPGAAGRRSPPRAP